MHVRMVSLQCLCICVCLDQWILYVGARMSEDVCVGCMGVVCVAGCRYVCVAIHLGVFPFDTHGCVYVWMCVSLPVCMCPPVSCVYPWFQYMHVCMRACMRLCIYGVCMHVCFNGWMEICSCVYVPVCLAV